MCSCDPQVQAAVAEIAKHSTVLCNGCKLASSKTTNPVARKYFEKAAKDVANKRVNLLKDIKVLHYNKLSDICIWQMIIQLKALAKQLTADNRETCAQTTKPLIGAIEALITFASSPQFTSTPATISLQVY